MTDQPQNEAGKAADFDFVALWEEHSGMNFKPAARTTRSSRWSRTPMSTTFPY
jgi:hypothetical protein